MRQSQLVSFFFIGLFLFTLYQLTLILSPFFAAMFWAAILAFAFKPLHQKLTKALGIKPNFGALLVTILVILIVVIPAAIVIVSLMNEAVDLYQYVSASIAEGKLDMFVEKVRQFFLIEWVQKLTAILVPAQDSAADFMLKTAQAIGNFSTIQLAAFTRNLLAWVLNLFIMTVLLFFFFRDGKKMHDVFFTLLPLSPRNSRILKSKIDEMFSAVIRGQFVTSIIQAFLTGITFWLLGLPLPFFFGFLAFIASMIPVSGASTVWVPFAIYLFAIQETGKAVALFVVGVLVISMSDNVLKPLLIGGKTKLPIFLLFLGILGGLNLYGFTGVFLGPVVISLFFVLLEIYQKEYQAKT